MTNKPLTPKEAAFVPEYIVDKNAAAAAIRAGYSPRSARTIAQRLMRKPEIAAAIKKALLEQQKRTLITADQVLLDIQAIGDKALKAGEYTPALRSRHLLGLHFKLFTEKHEHGGIGGGPVQFEITEKEADL